MTQTMLFPARFGGVLELLGYECETLTAPEQAQLIESIGTDDARRVDALGPLARLRLRGDDDEALIGNILERLIAGEKEGKDAAQVMNEILAPLGLGDAVRFSME